MPQVKHRSWQFTHFISRQPARSIVSGLRAKAGPDPDADAFVAEHSTYIETLKAAGAQATILPPLEEFPDSVFVEDPVLCAGKTAILLRPGAESRFGEAEAIAPDLVDLFASKGGRVVRPETGSVDGGDILLTDNEALIGLSERTDEEGVKALEPVLASEGYTIRIVETPRGVLHFKSDCGLLDEKTIFSTRVLADSGCFNGYQVIEAPAGEEAAANLIRFNDHVFMRTGFPRTEALLKSEGYSVVALVAEEAAKVDGGLSCMSLRIAF